VRRLAAAGLAQEPEALGELRPGDEARLSVDLIAERLVPRSNLPEETRHLLAVLLGLEDDAGERWPTINRTAALTGAAVGEVSEELERARTRWAEHRPELAVLRDELARWLALREGVATGDELADLLLGRRGSVTDSPYRDQRARAVVRGAVEAEASLGQPRFRGIRVGDELLVALDRPAEAGARGMIDWAADPLVEAAAALGERADELVDGGTVAGPGTVLTALRGIDWPRLPAGVAFDDLRIVQLAAAASMTAALSSRGELYPRGLDPVSAAKAARLALLSRGGLTPAQVAERIGARFPQAGDLPDRPELDAVLADASVGLVWDADAERYVLPDTADGLSGTRSRSTTSGTRYPTLAEADAEAADLDRRLDRLRTEGGFLAATVEPKRLDRAARSLARRLDAPLVDLDGELIAAMREAAETANARWEVLVDADALPPTDPRFRALQRLVGRALDRLDRRVRTAGQVAVAVDAGLLARYGRLDLVERWRDDLTRADGVAGTALHGLVLLVPGRDREQRPTVDGVPIPVVTAGQWTRVSTAWLDRTAA
jgi:hypothetical protein